MVQKKINTSEWQFCEWKHPLDERVGEGRKMNRLVQNFLDLSVSCWYHRCEKEREQAISVTRQARALGLVPNLTSLSKSSGECRHSDDT